MDAKDTFFVFALLLLSLGLFGSLSLTYCVWNKQTEVTSELADVQNELHKLQNEMKNLNRHLHNRNVVHKQNLHCLQFVANTTRTVFVTTF